VKRSATLAAGIFSPLLYQLSYPAKPLKTRNLDSFHEFHTLFLFYFCPMKRNETYRVADVSKLPRKRKGIFNQGFDEDGKHVRGLWIRNGVYYAQVRFSPTQTNRLHLQAAKTIPQTIAARQELRRKINRGEIRPPGAEEQEPAEEVRQAGPQLRLSTVHFMNSPCTGS
jgi:hypothetical protein